MIALWLAAGLLAGQPEAPILRRGGDDGGARERFWRAKAEEWLEDRLEAIKGAAGRPQRARKRLAARIVGEIPAFVAESEDMAPRLAALERLTDRLSQPTPDYSAIANAVAREMAIIAEWQKHQRRRRDLDALLVLAA